MKYVFIICALFGYLTGIAVAAPEKSQVMELLEGRHWSLDAEVFQLLGERTDRVLIEIAEDKSLINYLRFRALEALSLFPTENAATFLETTAKIKFAPFVEKLEQLECENPDDNRNLNILNNVYSFTQPYPLFYT